MIENEDLKKLCIVLALILAVLLYVFPNIGKWLDVTQKPVKSNIVICLGGGTVERVKKSIEMVEKGYADHFLLLGESWYNQPYLRKNYPHLPVDIDETPKNTVEEVLFIKQYMKKHGYKSALIVTDPPHSRRVQVLLSKSDEALLQFRIISSDVKWWDAEAYYKNARARQAVWYEGLKVMYTVLLDGDLFKL